MSIYWATCCSTHCSGCLVYIHHLAHHAEQPREFIVTAPHPRGVSDWDWDPGLSESKVAGLSTVPHQRICSGSVKKKKKKRNKKSKVI